MPTIWKRIRSLWTKPPPPRDETPVTFADVQAAWKRITDFIIAETDSLDPHEAFVSECLESRPLTPAQIETLKAHCAMVSKRLERSGGNDAMVSATCLGVMLFLLDEYERETHGAV